MRSSTHNHGDAAEDLAELTDKLHGLLHQVRAITDKIVCPTDNTSCEFTDHDVADLDVMLGRLDYETANMRRLADLAARRRTEDEAHAEQNELFARITNMCPEHPNRPADTCETDHCSECATPRDNTWPIGSDVCGRCWTRTEQDEEGEPGGCTP